MSVQGDLDSWHDAIASLLVGPSPRGESFDVCRRVLASDAPAEHRSAALSMLLEGAMADALTDVGVAQQVMRLLKARDRGEIDLLTLLTSS